MKIIQFIKKLFGIKSNDNLKPANNDIKQPLRTVCEGFDVELLDEEIICNIDFFAGKCWYVKGNPPEGMRPFRGEAYKSFILFSNPNVDNPYNINNVTVVVYDKETYQIPEWNWDYLLELDYNKYNSTELLETVSNERVIEADFSLIDKIKNAVIEEYKDIIGDGYTIDDIYTSYGKVIRKSTVVVTDKITNDIILFKTFDDIYNARYYYDNLLNID